MAETGEDSAVGALTVVAAGLETPENDPPNTELEIWLGQTNGWLAEMKRLEPGLELLPRYEYTRKIETRVLKRLEEATSKQEGVNIRDDVMNALWTEITIGTTDEIRSWRHQALFDVLRHPPKQDRDLSKKENERLNARTFGEATAEEEKERRARGHNASPLYRYYISQWNRYPQEWREAAVNHAHAQLKAGTLRLRDGAVNFTGWLYTVVERFCIDQLRKDGVRSDAGPSEAAENFTTIIYGPTSSPAWVRECRNLMEPLRKEGCHPRLRDSYQHAIDNLEPLPRACWQAAFEQSLYRRWHNDDEIRRRLEEAILNSNMGPQAAAAPPSYQDLTASLLDEVYKRLGEPPLHLWDELPVEKCRQAVRGLNSLTTKTGKERQKRYQKALDKLRTTNPDSVACWNLLMPGMKPTEEGWLLSEMVPRFAPELNMVWTAFEQVLAGVRHILFEKESEPGRHEVRDAIDRMPPDVYQSYCQWVNLLPKDIRMPWVLAMHGIPLDGEPAEYDDGTYLKPELRQSWIYHNIAGINLPVQSKVAEHLKTSDATITRRLEEARLLLAMVGAFGQTAEKRISLFLNAADDEERKTIIQKAAMIPEYKAATVNLVEESTPLNRKRLQDKIKKIDRDFFSFAVEKKPLSNQTEITSAEEK